MAGKNLRYKIVVGVLILALVILLALNVYYYSVMVDRQATINDLRGQIVVAWGEEMSIAGYYLQNATTNIDISGVRSILRAASNIGSAGWKNWGDLYWRMSFTASCVEEDLALYAEGSPIFVKRINSTAIELIQNLAQKMQDTAGLILNGDIDVRLRRREGVDPTQLLKEKGVLDDVIDYCDDIQNLSQQIFDVSPKFK